MAKKKYAKNPAELSELAIDNPGEGEHRKNPKRVIAGYKSYVKKLKKQLEEKNKKLSKQNNEDTPMSRTNPEDVLDKGKNMVLQSIFVIGGSFFAGKIINYATDKFGDQLSPNMRNVIGAGVPVLAGATLATYGKNSKIAQDAASGMVISGVSTGMNEAFKKIMPQKTDEDLAGTLGYNYKNELADVMPEAIIIGKDGSVYTPDGSYKGNIKDNMPEAGESLLESSNEELTDGFDDDYPVTAESSNRDLHNIEAGESWV